MEQSKIDTKTSEDGLGDIKPIPRIQAHAFCQSNEVASILEQAGNDRRLAKARLKIEQGGIVGAINHYTSQQTPNVLIIETNETNENFLVQLNELAQICNENTHVLIIGHSNDVQLYRELIRRGVSDYLVAPFAIADIMRALHMIFGGENAVPLGKSTVFIGARGGVGASTLAHNVAFMLATKCQSDTLLLDMDLPFGTANIDFDHDPAQGIAEAILSSERIDDTYLDRLLVKCSERLSLLAAPSTLAREYDFQADEFTQVIEVATRGTPNVILDMPNIWTGWARTTLVRADQIVIVAMRDLACLRNAKNLLDYLSEHRPNDKPPLLALNMDSIPKRPQLPLDDFISPLGLKPSITIDFDAALFGQAMNNAQMISEVAPRSQAAMALENLANILLGKENVEAKPNKNFLQNLLKRA